MIFRRNNLNIGIGLGIFIPILSFLLLDLVIHLTKLPLKVRTIALIGICVNGILIQVFKRNRANESIRGTVLATVGLCIIWSLYYGKEILEEWEK